MAYARTKDGRRERMDKSYKVEDGKNMHTGEGYRNSLEHLGETYRHSESPCNGQHTGEGYRNSLEHWGKVYTSDEEGSLEHWGKVYTSD
ncbi:MAG: hypothetical protein WA667_15135, partial [Candidatus Nitrosopolaris sp.]